jgi:hypothetical protein
LIAGIDRTVRLLDCDIATQKRNGPGSLTDPTTPIRSSRMLAARRDNLKTPSLELRLSKLDQAERVAELA